MEPPDVKEFHNIDINELKEITTIQNDLNSSTSTSLIMSSKDINTKIEKVYNFCKNNKEKLNKLFKSASEYTEYLKSNNEHENNKLLISSEMYCNHLKEANNNIKLLEEDLGKVLHYILEAKQLQKSVQKDEEKISEKCYAAKGLFLGNLPLRQDYTIDAFTSACIVLKTIHQSLDETKIYATPTKKCCVVMFANSKYTNNSFLTNLPQVKEDVKLAEELFNKNQQFEFVIHENKTKKEMEEIIDKLRRKDFSSYSAVMVIYVGHGGQDVVYSKDSKWNRQNLDDAYIKKREFWEWVKQNGTICLQPVIVVFDACRGNSVDDTVSACYTNAGKQVKLGIKSIPVECHPNIQNLLIVYATMYKHVGWTDVKRGTLFLPKLLKIFEEKRDWDILAQVSEASRRILQSRATLRRVDDEDVTTETVNFFNLFSKQLLLFSKNTSHDWNDVEEYTISNTEGKLAIFVTPNDSNNDENIINLKNTMKGIGIEIHGTTFSSLSSEDFKNVIRELSHNSIVFIVVIGVSSCDDIHRKHIPELRYLLSYKKCPGLAGKPKVIFFLGEESMLDSDSQDSNADDRTIRQPGTTRQMASMDPPTEVSRYSDVLCYCDSSKDCLLTTNQILANYPHSNEGLVRLLITEGLARQEAVLSSTPPHIESSLQLKLVLSNTP